MDVCGHRCFQLLFVVMIAEREAAVSAVCRPSVVRRTGGRRVQEQQESVGGMGACMMRVKLVGTAVQLCCC